MGGNKLIQMEIVKYNFQGLYISVFSEESLNSLLLKTFKNDISTVAYGYSLGIIPKLKNEPTLLDITNDFNLLVTDGRLFYLYAKLFGSPLKYDISIPNLVFKTLTIANELSLSIFFLGGTLEANSKALNNVRIQYSNLGSIYGHHGYFNCSEEETIIKEIANKKIDIIFLTLATPEKELLAYKLKQMGIARLIIPCGGMIDVLAGSKKVSPKIIKKVGLAWFYRFIQEPKVRYRLLFDSILALFQTTFHIILDKFYYKKNNAYRVFISK